MHEGMVRRCPRSTLPAHEHSHDLFPAILPGMLLIVSAAVARPDMTRNRRPETLRWTRTLVLLAQLCVGCAHVRSFTVHPLEDRDALLHNPDMGWVLYENYPLDPPPNGS